MEVNKPICIIDACTLINLMYIDNGDDFLFKKMYHLLSIKICDKVIEEVRKNAFVSLNNLTHRVSTENQRIREEKRKFINIKIGELLRYQQFDNQILEDFGEDFFAKGKDIFSYTKNNGEFFSSCIALYNSRFNQKKITFYTDDAPAKLEFQPYFDFEQIGYIEDSVDLIMFIYCHNDDFKKQLLLEYLSELKSQYNTDLKKALNTTREYKSNNNDRGIRSILNEIEHILEKLDFPNFGRLFNDLLIKVQRKHKEFYTEMMKFKDLSNLQDANRLV
jgi:hypothetical protein